MKGWWYVFLSFFPSRPPSLPPSYLGLDKRIHIPKLLLNLLDRLRNKCRWILLVTADALDQVLQGFLKHGWSVCGGTEEEAILKTDLADCRIPAADTSVASTPHCSSTAWACRCGGALVATVRCETL